MTLARGSSRPSWSCRTVRPSGAAGKASVGLSVDASLSTACATAAGEGLLKGISREALRVIFPMAVAISIFSATGGRKPLSRSPTGHGLPALLSLFPHSRRHRPANIENFSAGSAIGIRQDGEWGIRERVIRRRVRGFADRWHRLLTARRTTSSKATIPLSMTGKPATTQQALTPSQS